jgi:DNA-binding transcriptional MocR family regulator
VTVQRAMRHLAALGLVESRPGVGTFVRAPRTTQPVDYGWQTTAMGAPRAGSVSLSSTQRTPAPDTIGLHSAYPARELLPERLVRAAVTRAARTDAAITRSPTAGLPELQAWFAQELASFAPSGVPTATARDVIVTAGSQSGLSSIFRALVGTGQPLVIESPTYWGANLAAKQIGVALIPVPTGPGGPDPDDVDRALRESGARVFYAQPTFTNPAGTQWGIERGREILEVVRDHGAFLIEDDWAHDLAIDADPRPLAAFDSDGHVVYLRSLTKSISPALRVAAVIARGPARERILADRAADAMYVSGLVQTAALDVVTQPGWRTHLRNVRLQLGARRDILLAALSQHVAEAVVEAIPVGGLNLWVRCPDGIDVDHVVRECETRGVVIAPGTEWFPAEPSGPFVRLNFSGENPDRFDDACRIIGESLRVITGSR